MAIDREAIKAKSLDAASAEELMAIVRAAGAEITPEKAAGLFEKAQRQKTGIELSIDELEAVSGGSDRDWLSEGCAATVEDNSWCDSNDNCLIWDITYEHPPVNCCKKCGGIIYRASGEWDFIEKLRCVNCGDNYEKW